MNKIVNIFHVGRIVVLLINYQYLIQFSTYKKLIHRSKSKHNEYWFLKILSQNYGAYILKKVFSILNIKSCLLKSFVSFEFLKKNGFSPVIHIGVDIINDEFKSHSWIELENNLIMEHPQNFSSYKTITIIK